MQWEYMDYIGVIGKNLHGPNMEDVNSLGLEGWELISVVPDIIYGRPELRLFFKRPIHPKPEILNKEPFAP